MNYKKFTIPCVSCHSLTSKSYARAHQGKCKSCFTGVVREPSKPKSKCAKCGATVTLEYEQPFQEYPGASVQGGYEWYECAKCGHGENRTDLRGYHIRENFRGW